MEIELPIFENMVVSGAIDKRHAQNINEEQQKVHLRREAATGIENGTVIGNYFSHIVKLMVANKQDLSGIDLDSLKSLKNSITPAAKLYNWNILLKEVEKAHIDIDQDTKSLISSGDVDMIKELITRLVGLEIEIRKELKAKEPTKTLEEIKEGIDILTMSSSKEATDTDSSLELILNLMCKAFKMKPKQAAALLTNSNQYLLHSVVKGLKGNFEPIIKFYRMLGKYVHHLWNLLELESQKNQNHSTMLMVMNALKTGLFSHNDEVILETWNLLSKISEVAFHIPIFAAIYQWFITTTQEGGISALLYILKKHEDLIGPVVFTMVSFAKGNLPNILKEVIRPLYPSPREYIAIINDFAHVLAENEKTRQEILDAGLVDFWFDENIKTADNEARTSSEERTTSVAFVWDLWILFPERIEERQDIKNQTVNVLKKLSSDKFRPLRICANAQMFRLLETFGKEKNPIAPTIFRNISSSLVDNHGDTTTREFIMKNLLQMFEEIPGIPVSFIIEPLIKLLQDAEGDTYIYNTIDFDFFWALAKHPKLSARNALPMIDFFAKIYLNDLSYATCSSAAFISIAERFHEENNIKEFIIKFLTVSISMLLTVEKPAEEQSVTKKKKLQELSLRGKNAKQRERQKKKEEKENLHRCLKKSFIVELARKIQNLRNEDINEHLKGLCLTTNRRNRDLFNKLNIGILVLLKFWGDPKMLSMRYIEEEEEKERKIKEEEERQIALQKEEEKKRKEAAALALAEISSEVRDTRTGKNLGKGGKSWTALLPYSRIPHGKIAKKAWLELDKIKLSIKEKEEIKKNEEKQIHLKIDRQRRALKKKLAKRRIEHGVHINNDKNKDMNIVFAEGEVEYNAVFDSKSGVPPIDLLDLEDEEERDVEAIKIFMKRYSKLWRFMFNKYSNLCFSSKNTDNFDLYYNKSETMNMAELKRFLTDHGFTKRHLSKEELAALIRLINLKKIKRFDLSALPYAGWLEFLIQVSHLIYSRKPFLMDNLPIAEQLYAFFNQMEKATKDKGESTLLYEDPDSTAMADPKLLKALNKKLLENPDYPIPEGYKKVNEKIIVHNYEVPTFIQMEESQRMALEVLDDLVFEKLKFHILEPILKTEVITKIRPVIRKEFAEKKRSVPRYLESLEGKIKPKTLMEKIEPPQINKMKYYSERKFNLTENMKLEIVNQPIVKRAQMQECAEVLWEILDAAEKGLSSLLPRNKYGPGGLKNKGILMREHLAKQEAIEYHKRYQKVDKISNKWKEENKKKEEEKKKQMEDTKGERLAARKKNWEYQQKQFKELVKHNEERVKEKQARLEEIAELQNQRMKEERNATKAQRDKWKKENEEFLEKEKEKFEKEVEDLIKEREELKVVQSEFAEKERETIDKMRDQVMSYFRKNKEKFKGEQKERDNINKFIQKPEMKAMLEKYDVPLRYFFEFYSKSEHHIISHDLWRDLETMNLREFMRFGYQSHIIPSLLQVEDIKFMFRVLVRERQRENEEIKMAVIDYEYFIKALVRIAALAEEFLGGQKEKRLQKKKEETQKEKRRIKQLKKTLAKKFNKKGNKSDDSDSDNSIGRGGETSGNETEKTEKTDKSRVRVTQRGARHRRKKYNYQSLKDTTLKNTSVLHNVMSEAELLKRKSKNVNIMLKEGTKAEILEHRQKIKVEDKRVTKEVDVKLITIDTIEALIKFLQLDPDDNKYTLDKKLNKVVRMNAGAKPNRILKSHKPEKAEAVDKDDTSSEDEEEGSQTSPKTGMSRTSKTGKSEDSDSD